MHWADVMAHFAEGKGLKRAGTILDRKAVQKDADNPKFITEETKLDVVF